MSRPKRDREQEDEETSQVWTRGAESDEVTAVGALRLRDEEEWPWQVVIPVAEFIRDEPLETELVEAVTRALLGVRGVREAAQEDREVWVVSGRASGKALVAAVGKALDRLEPRLRQHVDSLAG
jgi:hypothetical protein